MRERFWILSVLLVLTSTCPLLRAEQSSDMKWSQRCEELHWSCPTDTFVSEDAIILTLRLQESMFLDTALAFEIDTVLKAVKSHYPEIQGIRAFPDYVCNDILLLCDAAWTSAWLEDDLITGNDEVDSLGARYNLRGASRVTGIIFKLEFQQAMNMRWLGLLYDQIDDIISAGPNQIGIDGPDIVAFKKDDIWHLAFSNAWGDCMSGCIHNYYYYITVDPQFNVSKINEGNPSANSPKIHTWNIPLYFSATVFKSGDEILDIAQSQEDWWKRCHSLEVLGRFYANDGPWMYIDGQNEPLFDEIRGMVLSNPGEVVEILRTAKQDADEHVRKSARFALNQMDSLYQYFPLHEGDRWIYQCDSGGGFERNILKESKLYSHLFRHGEYTYRYKQVFLFDRYEYQRAWMSMDRGGQVYMRIGEQEQMWVDFTADVGSSWIVQDFENPNLSVTVTLQSVTDTVFVPAGPFVHCYRFYFDPGPFNPPWVEWYTRGVGLVKRSHYGPTITHYELISAVIDDKSVELHKGDVNDDGLVDIQDAVGIINIILGYTTPDVTHKWAADYNGDNKINILDVIALINTLLSL